LTHFGHHIGRPRSTWECYPYHYTGMLIEHGLIADWASASPQRSPLSRISSHP
jgi:hypothetical protein